MHKYAVIVAGGAGTRMGGDVPKQFRIIRGRPLLAYTLQTFLAAYEDLEVILVLPEAHVATGQRIVDSFPDRSRIRITAGGDTRFHSVQNGLALIEMESIVFVHDAVRCLVSINLVKRCYDAAVEHGSAIPVINSTDSLRILRGNENETIARTFVKQVQTPQTFQSKILLPAFLTAYRETFTDEATVIEAAGGKVHLVEGEETNIKITRPVDLLIAEQMMLERKV
jgi:2-C-methyl-D-erythritol 4-phosphate cytidylyltransferase